MGCSPSLDVPKPNIIVNRLDDRTPNDIHLLSRNQRHLVRKTWRYLADDMTGRGTIVFSFIFLLCPDLKKLFPFRDVVEEDLVNNFEYRCHAARFMQVVGAVVGGLSNLNEVINPLLEELGDRHSHHVGMPAEAFEVFKNAMILAWEQELRAKFTPEAKEAWIVVFDVIIFALRRGFLVGLGEQNRKQFGL